MADFRWKKCRIFVLWLQSYSSRTTKTFLSHFYLHIQVLGTQSPPHCALTFFIYFQLLVVFDFLCNFLFIEAFACQEFDFIFVPGHVACKKEKISAWNDEFLISGFKNQQVLKPFSPALQPHAEFYEWQHKSCHLIHCWVYLATKVLWKNQFMSFFSTTLWNKEVPAAHPFPQKPKLGIPNPIFIPAASSGYQNWCKKSFLDGKKCWFYHPHQGPQLGNAFCSPPRLPGSAHLFFPWSNAAFPWHWFFYHYLYPPWAGKANRI